jgi:shikimate kinase
MKTNIVLTGLMGVGKTTLGKRLAEITSMLFIDLDEEIEKLYGPIKNLFEKGETYFRDIESRTAESFSKKDSLIISTGGGIVLRASNMAALSENSLIFYLKRPIEDIVGTVDPSNRPLLKNGTDILYRLQEEREPLYQKYCDHSIDASDIEQAVNAIMLFRKNKQS